jgi:hypothetical protein
MYYNFPQNRKYMINKDLVVKLDSKIVETNGVDIDVEIYGVVRTVELKWLYGISLYGIIMPKGYEDNIFDIIFKPINLKSHKVKEDVIPVFIKPIKVNKIYRMIAREPNYAISSTGVVLDVVLNTIISRDSTKGMYKTVTLSNSTSHTIHRLVALTWVVNDDFISKPIVNHIDGNKLNCDYKNLEWNSFSDNANHAIMTGLSPQSEAYRILDTITGREDVFYSVTTLSKYVGLNTIPHLSHKIARHAQYILQNRYIIKATTNDEPWVSISIGNKRPNNNFKTPAIIEAMNVKTGEIIKDTLTNLSIRLKINRNTMDGLKRMYKQHNGFGYVFRDPELMTWDDITIVENIYEPKLITATSTLDKSTISFKSLREVSKYFDCDKKTIGLRLNNNREYKSYTFKIS